MTAVEWERRWARPVAIATLVAALLFLVGLFMQISLLDQKDDATQLTSAHDHSSALLAGASLYALGGLLFSAPLYYLLKAARARNETISRWMLPFAFLGPLLLAVRSILLWAATNDVASQFISGSDHSTDAAKHLIDNSSLADSATALGFPAALAFVIATAYIPLMAMRVGLITRFWGTLGMSLGVASALIRFVPQIGLTIWFAYIGFLIGGWLKDGRPPAWETGEAIPWPPPERRGASKDGVVEGDGTEIDVGPKEILEPELPVPAETDEPAVDEQGLTAGQRRKKRKRRE
jgi:hypothetical protein